eukprot:767444-Hanusia_phi.AAC.14
MPFSASLVLLVLGHLILPSIEILSISHHRPHGTQGIARQEQINLLFPLRGGAPKKVLSKQEGIQTYPPGSLPQWAEAITMTKNLTASQRVFLCQETFRLLQENVSKHAADPLIFSSSAGSGDVGSTGSSSQDEIIGNGIDPETGDVTCRGAFRSVEERREFIKKAQEEVCGNSVERCKRGKSAAAGRQVGSENFAVRRLSGAGSRRSKLPTARGSKEWRSSLSALSASKFLTRPSCTWCVASTTSSPLVIVNITGTDRPLHAGSSSVIEFLFPTPRPHGTAELGAYKFPLDRGDLVGCMRE